MQRYAEDQITRALRTKANATAVARELGIRPQHVWRVAKKVGIDLAEGKAARGGTVYSPAEHTRILAALGDDPRPGPVAKQLTAEFGRPVNRSAIAYMGRQAGVLPPCKPRARTAPAVDLDTPWTEMPENPKRERTPAEYQAEQRALMEARHEDKRDEQPLPAGHGWDALIARTPSLAGAPYPRPVFRL
jgi:hypothetical protein